MRIDDFQKSTVEMDDCNESSVEVFFITSTKFPKTEDLSKMTVEMDDSNQSSVEILSSLQRNVLKMKICTKAQQKWMILRKVLWKYCRHFNEMSHN